MEMTLIFLFALTAAFAGLLLLHLTPWFVQLYRSHLMSFVLRRLAYPLLYRRFPFLRPMTRLRALALALYIGITIFFNVWNVSTTDDAASRAGWLSLLNMVPLFVSGRLAMVTKWLGLSLQSVIAAHIATGTMTVSQIAAHIILKARQNPILWPNPVDRSGVLASSCLLGVIFVILLRQRLFKIFAFFHMLGSIAFLVFIWIHSPNDAQHGRLYLIIVIAIYATVFVAHNLSVILQNFLLQRRCASVELELRDDAVQITLNMDRPLEVKPGQFVYLCIPAVDIWSIFRPHPFMVAWKEGDSFAVFAQVHTGFTSKLKYLADSETSLLAFVDGPYGTPPHYSDYKHVAFVAGGIGVVAHMLALKKLLRDYRNRDARLESISLYWLVERDSQREWVRHWMDDLLRADKHIYVLKLHLFEVPSSESIPESSSESIPEVVGEHGTIVRYGNSETLVEQLSSDLHEMKGKVLVSVSSKPRLRDDTRDLVVSQLFNKRTIQLHLSDFQLDYQRGSWLARKAFAWVRGPIKA